jgi:predicted porin
MKKTILAAAVVAASFATSAVAANYDKVGVAVEANSEHFGVALGTGTNTAFANTARTVSVYSNSLPVTVGATVITDSEDTAYRVSVSKQFDFAVAKSTAVYVIPEMNFTWGDGYEGENKDLRVAGIAGVAYSFKNATAFAQVAYDVGSTSKDHYVDLESRDGHTMIGVRIPVKGAELTVAAVELRDADFDRIDREAMVKMSFKF